MLSINFLFDRVNNAFSMCQASPVETRVGEYMVTSYGGGLNGHIHVPMDINHDDNSFAMSPAYGHNHNVKERVVITGEGEMVSTVNARHSHKWAARKMGMGENVVDKASKWCFN